MGLFDKKICDFCGGGIGLLGNRKLSDGNMCKECAEKISPWVNDRRSWSVAEMQEHLSYRGMNYSNLEYFQPTRAIGNDNMKLYIDCNNAQWFLCRHSNYRNYNPDIFGFEQVTGCQIEIRDNRREVYFNAPDGRRVSFIPPEYDYDYDFYFHVFVNCPFVQEITFKINDYHIEDIGDYEYLMAESIANNMKSVFDQMMSGTGQMVIPSDYCPDAATIAALRRERELRIEQMRRYRTYSPGTCPAEYVYVRRHPVAPGYHQAPPPPPVHHMPPPPPPVYHKAPPPPPVHHTAPTPVHHQAPPPVHHQAPPPVHHQAPPPVHHQAPPPVVHHTPTPAAHAAPPTQRAATPVHKSAPTQHQAPPARHAGAPAGPANHPGPGGKPHLGNRPGGHH